MQPLERSVNPKCHSTCRNFNYTYYHWIWSHWFDAHLLWYLYLGSQMLRTAFDHVNGHTIHLRRMSFFSSFVDWWRSAVKRAGRSIEIRILNCACIGSLILRSKFVIAQKLYKPWSNLQIFICVSPLLLLLENRGLSLHSNCMKDAFFRGYVGI